MSFPVQFEEITQLIDKINPIAYGKTRNYLNGAVTRLSPYISRGVIQLSQVKESVLQNYTRFQAEKLLQELAWREYWQRIWEARGEEIFTDLKKPQEGVDSTAMPEAILQGNTGIEAVDESIRNLYATGYMHNHCRMYVAAIACNIGRTHWLQPSRWMYYHLLDGDLASNSLSWQWVAGTFSSKKYYCNQENINKYTGANQQQTFLDRSYEELMKIEVPNILQLRSECSLTTSLPPTATPVISEKIPTLIYNAYNLDPLWHTTLNANRILLLEPSHYQRYPVSARVIDFMLALSKNIPNIQVFTGSFETLKQHAGQSQLIYKKHPAFQYYFGEAESPDYLFPQVSGAFPSFFAYWKKCEKHL